MMLANVRQLADVRLERRMDDHRGLLGGGHSEFARAAGQQGSRAAVGVGSGWRV